MVRSFNMSINWCPPRDTLSVGPVYPLSPDSIFRPGLFANRRILVTGASSGIGLATAQLLSGLGADLILTSRNAASIPFPSPPDSSQLQLFLDADLSEPDDIFHKIRSLPSEWLPLHGVFHSAGSALIKPISLSTTQDFLNITSASVAGALNLARAVSSKKIMAPAGSLVFMSSVAAHSGTSGMALYSASKGAIESATKSLAVELAPKSIRVNCITAGAIKTPMHDRLIQALPTQFTEAYISRHPLGLGTPLDVANIACYLLSDASRWITGASMSVDGGYSAQ